MRFKASLSRSLRLLVAAALIYVSPVGSAWAEGAEQPPRSAAQLAQLVAPIALYPDALLSQVLMASTYPLEVVEAARWSQANPGVTGQALEDAMQKQPWDPSVKALTAVPQTLLMMNDKIDWTRQLGDAFLAQQADVLSAVQQLRQRADNAGNLKTTEQQKVTKEPAPPQSPPPAQGAQQGPTPSASSAAPAYVYTIESANPDQIYLPIYDPGIVYGTWPYPDYEPYAWYPSGYYAGAALTFATAAVVGTAIWGNINWRRNSVGINPLRYNQFNRTNIASGNWTHNPAHRGSVPYRDRNVAQRFGDQGKAASREAFRGKAEAGRKDLAKQGGAAKVAQKAGAGAKQKATAGSKQAAKAGGAKSAGSGKQARSKQATQQKQAVRSKQGGQARAKQAARSQQATRSKQAARPRQTASRSQGAHRRPSPASHRAMAQRPSGMSHRGGGGGMRAGGGGRGGGGGGRGGGGRRSDIALKHDITLLGHLESGLGFYRFAYLGSDKAYVGVMAQEVQAVMPAAVVRGRDGYLRVHYDRLGLELHTYDLWIASGARIPSRRAN